jgi:hypothetical protein
MEIYGVDGRLSVHGNTLCGRSVIFTWKYIVWAAGYLYMEIYCVGGWLSVHGNILCGRLVICTWKYIVWAAGYLYMEIYCVGGWLSVHGNIFLVGATKCKYFIRIGIRSRLRYFKIANNVMTVQNTALNFSICV